MDNREILMHLAYGRYAGKSSTCGNDYHQKQVFATEEAAIKAANSLNSSGKARHEVEPYPCYWCSDRFPDQVDDFVHYYWHIGRKITEKERAVFSIHHDLEMEIVHLDYAEPVFGIQKGKTGLLVHNRLLCAGEYCCLHNPSSHSLVNAPLNWRSDRGMMERICLHGIGHPDPDDMAFKRRAGIPDDGVHGCDGCCSGQWTAATYYGGK